MKVSQYIWWSYGKEHSCFFHSRCIRPTRTASLFTAESRGSWWNRWSWSWYNGLRSVLLWSVLPFTIFCAQMAITRRLRKEAIDRRRQSRKVRVTWSPNF